MKIKSILFTLVTISSIAFSQFSFAQDDDGAYFEMANIYHQRESIISCEFITSAIDRIKEMDEDTLKKEILLDVESLIEIQSEIKESELKENVNSLAKSLSKAAQGFSPKVFLTAGLENLCRYSAWPLVYISRKAALMNSAVVNTALHPASSVFSFWNGFLSRRNSELGVRSDFLYRAFGPRKNLGRYILGLLGTELTNTLVFNKASMVIINAFIGIEMITNYRCYYANKEDQRQQRFCQTYASLKDFFHSANQRSFKRGKKLQSIIDTRISQWRQDFSRERFCNFSKERQVKRARRALQRNDEINQDKRIAGLNIILPIQKNDCTKIIMFAKEEADIISLKKDFPKLEGIEIVHSKQDVFPDKYYYTTEELNKMTFIDSLCYEVESSHFNKFMSNRFAPIRDLLKSSLATSMIANPEFHKIALNDKLLHHGPVGNLKNIIFAVGPSEEERTIAVKLKDEKKEITQRIKRDYNKMMKSDTFEDCKRTLQKRRVNLTKLESDLQRLNVIGEVKALKKFDEFEVIEKKFNEIKNDLQLDWELKSTNSLQQITNALASNEVANITIISHGKKSGHLVDVLDQELPREAFSSISPTVQSVNFYSCFSKNLLNLYSLEKKIKSQPSYYKIRYVTNVDENDFMGEENLAPLAGLDHYLSHLDKFLFNASRGSEMLQEQFGSHFPTYQSPQECHLETGDMIIKKGSYAFTLNDQLLGMKNESSRTSRITFPCHYLKSSNTLKIKNIINSGGSIIENLDQFHLQLEDLTLDQKYSILRKNSLTIFRFDIP